MMRMKQDGTRNSRRIEHVETFVNARKMVKTDPRATVKICDELLSLLSIWTDCNCQSRYLKDDT